MLNRVDLKSVEKSFIPVRVLTSFANSAYSVIIPLIIVNIIQNDRFVGYYYSALSVLSVSVALLSTTFFQKHNKIRVYKANILVSLLAILIATLLHNHMSFLVLNSIRAFAVGLAGFSISFMFRELIDKKDLDTAIADNERYTSIGSMGGSFIAGYLALYFGNEMVFILVAFMFFLAYIMFSRMKLMPVLKDEEEHLLNCKNDKVGNKKISFFANLKDYYSNLYRIKLTVLIFFCGLGDSIRETYLPLSIIAMQYSQDTIGNTWTVYSLITFLFMKYCVVKAKKIGYKKAIIWGWILSVIISSLMAIFLSFEAALLFLIIFVLYSFVDFFTGYTIDNLFYSVSSVKEQQKFLGLYSSHYRLGFVLGPLLGSAVLSLSLFVFNDTSLSAVWIAAIVVGLLGLLVTVSLKKQKMENLKKC